MYAGGRARAAGRAHVGGDRVVRYRTCLHNTIGDRDVLKARGWQEMKEGEEWDFYWPGVTWPG